MRKELCEAMGLMPIWAEGSVSWPDRRRQILEVLCREEYGFLPRTHDSLRWEVQEEESFCAGKATLRKVMLTAQFGEEAFSFPVCASVPCSAGPHPFFVYIGFGDGVPDRYLPIEEICDRGFAVLSFNYQDISADGAEGQSGQYGDGLAEVIFRNVKREDSHCGKIALWAWAASRVLDYAQSLPDLDLKSAAVIGHSRLGKTALLAGALDERFACVISNDSGCSGAALSRMKEGESIETITRAFPYWFCGNYPKYAGNEQAQPFDQHFLLAAVAPRKVYVASASQDAWANPPAEYLACYAAGEVYEKLGLKGLEAPDRLPQEGDVFQDGDIGYHMRKGTHYLSREDWNRFMDYMERKVTVSRPPVSGSGF